ncbi:MAG TPA: hypothetical protein VM327_01540 [Candidatus Thermoplasmatota archaeon]|nr:hypothetical protein [Candidatus Thermoplasmatota archaeon]
MTQRLASPAVTALEAAVATVAPAAFTMKASRTHVEVRATGPMLGMKDLMATMKREPLLHNCVIEQCAFDGDCFTATLRIER